MNYLDDTHCQDCGEQKPDVTDVLAPYTLEEEIIVVCSDCYAARTREEM
jgi:hypothetical protein